MHLTRFASIKSCSKWLRRIERSISESRDFCLSRQTSSLRRFLFNPQCKAALRAGSFHPQPAVRVLKSRVYSDAPHLPWITVQSGLPIPLPSGAWAKMWRNSSTNQLYDEVCLPPCFHIVVIQVNTVLVRRWMNKHIQNTISRSKSRIRQRVRRNTNRCSED